MLKRLQALEQQNIIRPLDYQFATLMHSMHPDPLLALVAAQVSYELGRGNVCMMINPSSDLTLFGLDTAENSLLIDTCGVAKTDWPDYLQNIPLIGDGSEPSPLVWDHNRLYLYRYWQYEKKVADFLQQQSPAPLNNEAARSILTRLFQRDYDFVLSQCRGKPDAALTAELRKWLDIEPDSNLDWPAIISAVKDVLKSVLNNHQPVHVLDQLIPESSCLNWQKVAAALAASRSFSVISGGPGTGKTTTVTRLLALLTELGLTTNTPPDIKLVAPTGKAAARLTESIGGALSRLNCTEEVRKRMPTQAGTLHRLLGVLPGKTGFIHNKNNRLHLDILVVDEASMIDLPMMSHLLDALPNHARLILLGDRDQLSSVEAGSVLGDICAAASSGYSESQISLLEALTGQSLKAAETLSDREASIDNRVSDSLCLLRKSYRFDALSGIGSLAKAINSGQDTALRTLFTSGFQDIELYPVTRDSGFQPLIQQCVEGYRNYLTLIREQSDKQSILNAFNQFQLLCALREGPYGVSGLNQEIQKALQQKGLLDVSGQWYEGRPILITRNDHGLGLYNGDIGITIKDSEGRLKVAFELPDQQIREILPSRLPEHETVFAMTIHKSQGSEFAHVVMVLPDKHSPVITRELVYTGITRAKSRLTVFSEMDILVKAANSPTRRASGLYQRLTR